MRFSPSTRARVLKKNNGNCYLCGEKIDPRLPHTAAKAYEIEHIIPKAQGGSDAIDNLLPSHKACNSKKSDLPVNVALSNQRAEKWKTSRNWN